MGARPLLDLIRRELAEGHDIEHAVLQRFVLAGGRLGPPVPIEELCRWLGCIIIRLTGVEETVSGILTPRDRLIGVNARHHPRRQRFSIAHELGHLLLAHPAERRSTPEAARKYDAEANRCAAELLMPRGLLEPLLREQKTLAELASAFAVSNEAMMHRRKSLSQFAPRVLPECVCLSRRS